MSTQVQFKDYSMGFKDDDGKVYNLIDHLNMQLDEGKALGIVGESGCGKSMTSLSLMRLLCAERVPYHWCFENKLSAVSIRNEKETQRTGCRIVRYT